ncbi:MAG: hypothetical protein ABI619_10150, partial [Betaproteobacteria bacterium]
MVHDPNRHLDQLVADGASESMMEAHIANCPQCQKLADKYTLASLPGSDALNSNPLPASNSPSTIIFKGKLTMMDLACIPNSTKFGSFTTIKSHFPHICRSITFDFRVFHR